jgi:fermentation-respiration switch protein FrsA (DUF1100 family)
MVTAMVTAALVVAGFYLLLLVGAALGQRAMIYAPDPTPAEPAECGLPEMVPVPLRSPDGLLITGWYAPAPSPRRPTVIVFHGNAGTVAARAEKARRLLDAGFGLFLVEYRGYGGNPGRPSERALLTDARVVLNWLFGRGVPEGRMVLYGESLGGGLATALAGEISPLALVLECPFTALPDLAPGWILPALAWMLMVDHYDNRSAIGRVGAPLLIVHGEQDALVPAAQARTLHAAATAAAEKDLAMLPFAGHDDLWDHGGGERVIAFLEHLAARRAA